MRANNLGWFAFFLWLAVEIVAAGPATATLDRADAAWREGRYAKAAQELVAPARAGDAEAQYRLGILYAGGQGLVEDDHDAAMWLRKAADQNHADAQEMLGRLYLQGAGVEEDLFEAMKWFYLAKEQGHADAAEVYAEVAEQLPTEIVEAIETKARAWRENRVD